jgi:hypothetical protein
MGGRAYPLGFGLALFAPRLGLAALLGLLFAPAFPGLAAGHHDRGESDYVLRYRGIQCVRAPCPVWEVVDLAACKHAAADSIDTTRLRDPDHAGEMAQTWLARNPVTVRGRLKSSGEAMVLEITKILGGPDPRAERCSQEPGQE